MGSGGGGGWAYGLWPYLALFEFVLGVVGVRRISSGP